MYTSLSVVAPPAALPVSVDLAKAHARIDTAADDAALLPLYIGTATSLAEAYLDRALITQTLTWSFARTAPPNAWPLIPAPIYILPLGIEWTLMHALQQQVALPRAPLQSVTGITMGQWGQADQTLTLGTDYDVDSSCQPARVRLYSQVDWSNYDHLTVTYVAGYGATSASVPLPIQHTILMTVAHLYEHRGDGVAEAAMPTAAMRLLDPYRLVSFGL